MLHLLTLLCAPFANVRAETTVAGTPPALSGEYGDAKFANLQTLSTTERTSAVFFSLFTEHLNKTVFTLLQAIEAGLDAGFIFCNS